MKPAVADPTPEYVAAVARYLERRDEVALSVAYELGRRALGDGLGVLEMAAMHRVALENTVLRAPAQECEQLARAAADFFRESLSPFEMTFRGYRDANRELNRLNQALAQQKAALETSNRELDAFSYSVSHDLRAPVRRLDGFSQILLEDYEDRLPEEGKRYLRCMRESAQDMGQLIDALLGLARFARGELERTAVDLTSIARRVAARLLESEPARKAEFIIEEAMHAEGDPRLLGAMLENLLGNAWKFSGKRQRTRIEVATNEREGRTVYFVRDNGAGFDMTYAAKLFGAFQRLHSAAEFEGTGIGLATVQRIVHRHSGQVWAEGEVGVGATVYFVLWGDRPNP
jgi:light-regulated signal transduction histidine kinase (bacteriophytochrome)